MEKQLVSLLRTIAERRVCAVARFWQAQRRDVRRHADLGSALGTELTSADPTPSKAVSEKELVAETLTRLPEDARQVLSWRQDGLSLAQNAHLCCPAASPEAERKRYERVLDRVAADLGLQLCCLRENPHNPCYYLAISPDQRWLALRLADGTLPMLDLGR